MSAPNPTREERAGGALKTLRYYCTHSPAQAMTPADASKEVGIDWRTAAIDLLADLMHLHNQQPITDAPFDDMIGRARHHFHRELNPRKRDDGTPPAPPAAT